MVNPAYQQWWMQDHKVLGFLLSSMSKNCVLDNRLSDSGRSVADGPRHVWCPEPF
jgi:hypothetical protein